MRRNEKKITDPLRITRVLRRARVCRLGFSKDDVPYIVPVSFGYDGCALFFHTALDGKKLDHIEANNLVCFEMEHGVELREDAQSPCQWTFSFQSVIGYGRVIEATRREAKLEGLAHIMAQYSEKAWSFEEAMVERVRVWRLDIDSMTGKQSVDKG